MIPETQTHHTIGLAHELWKSIMEQREEIIRAFIAKHGCDPDDAIQVEQRTADGTSRWYVRLKDNSDRKRERVAEEIRKREAARPAFIITCRVCHSADIERISECDDYSKVLCNHCGTEETF